MRVRLKLNSDKRESARNELEKLGVEICEDADLILTEENFREGELLCRASDERVMVPIEEILYIESLGKEVFVYTIDKKYATTIRLYVLEGNLPAERFLRISNSVIVGRNSIKKIRPGLSQKFYLTLKNDDVVDVTRTYYVRFKEYFGL